MSLRSALHRTDPVTGRRRDDRGAIFVQMAIILPFLITLVLGVFELGMGWRAQMTVSNSARAGARVASNVSVDPLADYTTLSSVGSSIRSINNITVNWVTIYKVTSTDITPPANCVTAAAITAHGNAGSSCNTYSGAELTAVVNGIQTGFGNCAAGGAKDAKWCPTTRVVDQASTNGPDTIGVAMSITYPTFTKLFGSTRTIIDKFAMRLEPAGSLGGP